MKTKLDHIYGVAGGDLAALQNKVDNLANIAAKTNLDNQFTTNQTIPSVIITGAVDANNKATTKAYVDEKFNMTQLITWTGDAATTNLSWDKSSEFTNSGTGNYEFHIRVYKGNKYHYFTERIKLDNLTGTWIGQVKYFKEGVSDSATIQTAAPNIGLSFVYTNKNIKLVRYGSTFGRDTTIHIFWKKNW